MVHETAFPCACMRPSPFNQVTQMATRTCVSHTLSLSVHLFFTVTSCLSSSFFSVRRWHRTLFRWARQVESSCILRRTVPSSRCPMFVCLIDCCCSGVSPLSLFLSTYSPRARRAPVRDIRHLRSPSPASRARTWTPMCSHTRNTPRRTYCEQRAHAANAGKRPRRPRS